MGTPQAGPDPGVVVARIAQAFKLALSPIPGIGDSATAGIDQLTGQLQALTAAVTAVLNRPSLDFSQIERQVYAQFLESEIQFLKSNQTLAPKAVSARVQQDMKAAQAKQKQLRALLVKAFAVDGVDTMYKPLLAQQRDLTRVLYVLMNLLGPDNFFAPTLDLYLNKMESTLTRKVLYAQFVQVAKNSKFDADAAWSQLIGVWNGYASAQQERFEVLKKAWAVAGGGADVNQSTSPTAVKVVRDYYDALFKRAETGH
jgi:hypothetical protein